MFEFGYHVRLLLKHESIFEKSNVVNWSEEVFVLKKIKNTVPWTVISDIITEEIVGKFYEKAL